MYQGLRAAVVVPAYNEERFIPRTLARIPDFVDHVFVIDDASTDATPALARAFPSPRITVISHPDNRGVGASILTGYQAAIDAGHDVAAVMAGDGQMDPADLPALLDPIAQGRADYAKGNRFAHPDLLRAMPWLRLAGNLALSFLTRISAGYPHLMDSQCGYTAAATSLLRRLDFAAIYPRYGFPNDLLAHVHSANGRVAQVPVRPLYDGQDSGINPLLAILPISRVLARSFLHRRGRERSPSLT